MTWMKILEGPLWLQWVRTVLFFLLFAEYMRLILTTESASYRLAVTIIWGAIFAVSLISLIKEIRRRSERRKS